MLFVSVNLEPTVTVERNSCEMDFVKFLNTTSDFAGSNVFRSALFALVLAWMIQRIVRYLRWIQTIERIPGPALTGSHPWLAHVHHFRNTIGSIPTYPNTPLVFPFLTGLGRDFDQEGLARYWVFNPYRVFFARVNVIVFDPDLVQQLLTEKKQTSKLVKNQRVYRLAGRVFGSSLLSLPDGALWKHQRKIVAQTFRQRLLEHANRTVAELLYEKVFVRWNSACDTGSQAVAATEEMSEFSARITAEVLGLVAFGHSFGGLDDEEDEEESLFQTYQTLLTITSNRIRMPLKLQFLQFRDNAAFRKAADRLDSTISAIVKDRLRKSEVSSTSAGSGDDSNALLEESGPNKDLLDYMIMEGKDGYKMPFEYLFGNTRMFLFAGHDTTAGSLAYAFWEIASHTHVQEKLRLEVDSLFDSCNAKIPPYKDLMRLPYLDACIREVLRLHCPVVVARTLVDDITLHKDGKTYLIPKGTNVNVTPIITQRRPASYPDQTLDFVPERFLDRTYGASEYIPFSIGPRNCVGMPLAMTEMKTILAHVVRHYKIRPNAQSQEPIPVILLTLRPHEVLLDIEKR